MGCGAGAFERRLPELNIIGLDKDSALLAEAKKSGSGDFVQGDAMSLCFRGGAFDGIFFVTSLEFMEDYSAAVAEAARVLGGGGKFVAMMLNPRSWHFRSRAGREGSYFNNINLLEPARVRDYASRFFPTEVEYFLGIKEGRVFDSSDKIIASLYVVKGRKP